MILAMSSVGSGIGAHGFEIQGQRRGQHAAAVETKVVIPPSSCIEPPLSESGMVCLFLQRANNLIVRDFLLRASFPTLAFRACFRA
jgi:hypothetical protein